MTTSLLPRHSLLPFMALVFSFSAFAGKFAAPQVVQKHLLNKTASVLDVREKAEVAGGMIKGAIWLPMSTLGGAAKLQSALKQVPTDKPVYIYCAAGGRASRMVQRLNLLGYKSVHNAGGYSSLKAAGLPTTK